MGGQFGFLLAEDAANPPLPPPVRRLPIFRITGGFQSQVVSSSVRSQPGLIPVFFGLHAVSKQNKTGIGINRGGLEADGSSEGSK